MSDPTDNNHDLAAAVAEISRTASAAATPVLTTVGDATATAPATTTQAPGKGRGAFIVLEGLDRSGKTTQVKLLQSRLAEAGREVSLMRFPGEFFFWFLLLFASSFFSFFFFGEPGAVDLAMKVRMG